MSWNLPCCTDVEFRLFVVCVQKFGFEINVLDWKDIITVISLFFKLTYVFKKIMF